MPITACTTQYRARLLLPVRTGLPGVRFLMLLALLATGSGADVYAQGSAPLRVCADANNLPFSNAAGEGFENALAELLADELGMQLEYTWWPQRRGFIRNTLDAGTCDVVLGVPADYELTATTQPYYRSGYVAVTRNADAPPIASFEDPRLQDLRIGLHTIGDDYSNPPPAQLLALQGIRDKVSGYSIYGDYSQPDPPRELIDAVARDEIDVAFAWGPVAGFFALQHSPPLAVQPLSSALSLQPLQFDIAIGMRRSDDELRQVLNGVLTKRKADIDKLLARFGIPVFEREENANPDTGSDEGGQNR